MIKVIEFTEHSNPKEFNKCENDINTILGLIGEGEIKLDFPSEKVYMGAPNYLGINTQNNNLLANYYIGATWFKENEIAAVVKPKIVDIDLANIFWEALKIDTQKESNYFAQCYGIDFNKPQIEISESLSSDLTLLLILHYISLMKRLCKQGLKKGYVYREENLKSKVKGRLLLSKHVKTNMLYKRDDRMFCGYYDYTVDIPENRLLKKTLIIVEHILRNISSLNNRRDSLQLDIIREISTIKTDMHLVSEDIEVYEIKTVSNNKIFKNYGEAISVAKMILKKYDYSYLNIDEKNIKTFPFWVDMPRLYEMYVYNRLLEQYPDTLFQVEGSYKNTVADFVVPSKKWIIDAKYKPKYEYSNPELVDIREVSGYARDTKILEKTGALPTDVSCILVYQDNESNNKIDVMEDLPGTSIAGLYKFYKARYSLPIIKKG